MANAGELVTKFSADNSDLVNKIKQSQNVLQNFAKIGVTSLVGLATAATAAFTTMAVSVKNTSKELGDLFDNSQKLNISVDSFQSLAFAAEKAGVSSEGLQNSLAVMQRQLGEVSLTGKGGAADALKTLGISIKDIINLSPDRQFEVLAKSLSEVNNVSERAALAQKLFGKSAKDSLALFSSDIVKTREQFVSLGLAISDSQAAAADELDETLSLVGKIGDAFEQKLTAKVAPALTEMINGLIQVGQETNGLEAASNFLAKGFLQAFKVIIAGAAQLAKVINAVKEEIDAISNRFADVRDTAFELTAKALGDPSISIGEARQFRDQSNSQVIAQQTIDNLDAIYVGLDKAQDKIGKPLNAAQSFGELVPEITSVAKSFEKAGQSAEKAASKFDDAISNVFKQAGQSELERILKPITDAQKANGQNGIIKAQNATFDSMIRDIVTKFSLPGADQEGLRQSLPKQIQELENIIKTEAGGFGQLGLGTKAGGTFSITGNTPKDVTGMIGALQELKKFIGLNDQKTKIDVAIKVEKSPDFITTILADKQTTDAINLATRLQMEKEAIGVSR